MGLRVPIRRMRTAGITRRGRSTGVVQRGVDDLVRVGIGVSVAALAIGTTSALIGKLK